MNPQPMNTCGGCPNRWTGTSAAHCASCHTSFTSVSGFDAHRRGGECRTPAAVGLQLRDRAGYQAWTFPADEERAERLAALRATREAVTR